MEYPGTQRPLGDSIGDTCDLEPVAGEVPVWCVDGDDHAASGAAASGVDEAEHCRRVHSPEAPPRSEGDAMATVCVLWSQCTALLHSESHGCTHTSSASKRTTIGHGWLNTTSFDKQLHYNDTHRRLSRGARQEGWWRQPLRRCAAGRCPTRPCLQATSQG